MSGYRQDLCSLQLGRLLAGVGGNTTHVSGRPRTLWGRARRCFDFFQKLFNVVQYFGQLQDALVWSAHNLMPDERWAPRGVPRDKGKYFASLYTPSASGKWERQWDPHPRPPSPGLKKTL